MTGSGVYRFGEFVLDTRERQLRRLDQPVKVSSRYFDALALLVREEGRLVDKDRLFAEVWKGVPVGDEALTQCMRTLRRSLGDDASRPRFIETVPKHGYRFVAPVEAVEAVEALTPATTFPRRLAPVPARAAVVPSAVAGALAGAAAGVLGGLFYGVVIAFGPTAPQVGAVSILILLLALNVTVGALGGFGVGLGWASGAALRRHAELLSVLGAALGGLVVGGLGGLFGIDAFHLVLGRAPEQITGGAEGAALGAAVGLGLLGAGAGRDQLRRIARAALATAVAAACIVLLGGTLMAGSIDSLAASLTGTDLPLERINPFFEAVRFDGAFEVLLASLEGLLFGGFVAAALVLVQQGRRPGLPGTKSDDFR